MKVLILAGGYGTRLGEETGLKPKPMVEIGGKPILWHIMKCYSHYGFNDFVVLTGYKSHMIKDYFVNYYTQYSDITVDMKTNSVEIHKMRQEEWKVTMLYTGQDNMTGSRIAQAKDYINEDMFLLTYGDGLSNHNILDSIEEHKKSNKILSLTAVKPSGRFGVLDIDSNKSVTSFREKSESDNAWINGGFFVANKALFDYIPNGDDIVFEKEPLEALAKENQIHAYQHNGFWKCMDTQKDKNDLTEMWTSTNAPWKLW